MRRRLNCPSCADTSCVAKGPLEHSSKTDEEVGGEVGVREVVSVTLGGRG